MGPQRITHIDGSIHDCAAGLGHLARSHVTRRESKTRHRSPDQPSQVMRATRVPHELPTPITPLHKVSTHRLGPRREKHGLVGPTEQVYPPVVPTYRLALLHDGRAHTRSARRGHVTGRGFFVWPGCSGFPCPRPAPASQAREPDSPFGPSSVATSL
jgi:hypothetical protein